MSGSRSRRDVSDTTFSMGDWTVDLADHELVRGSERHPLKPKEAAVLRALVQAAPGLVASEDLMQRCWPGVVVSDHALHEVVARLRKLLGDDARRPRYIETVARRGYRVTAEVRTRPQSPAATAPGALRAGFPVAAALILALLVAGVIAFRPVDRIEPPANVAILPLFNASGDASQDYLGVAVAEEIFNELSRQTSLSLIAPTSTRRFRNAELDAREIGRQLNARFLLAGSVTRGSTQTRINVRLIDATRNMPLWSESYDRDLRSMDRVLELYDEVARRIARSLPDSLAGAPLDARRSPATDSLTAYNLLQEAWYVYRETSNLERMESLLDRALAEDPAWPRALVAKAWLVRNKADAALIEPATAGYAQARSRISEALALAPDYPHGHVIRGSLILRQELDFARAMAAYDGAEQRDAPMLHWVFDKTFLLNLAGRFEEALALLTEYERLDPMFAQLKLDISRNLVALGRHAAASAKVEEALELAPRSPLVVATTFRHYLLHDVNRPRVEELLARLEGTGLVPPWVRPSLALLDGRPEPFRDWVKQTARTRNPATMTRLYYRAGQYGRYLDAFDARVGQGWALFDVALFLREHPDHWQTLQQWALADRSRTPARLERINDYRATIDRITARMVL